MTCCETVGTFYLACYLRLDTHNMRGEKTSNVDQHIAPGNGQSNYTIENQACFEGCKTWKTTRQRADRGGVDCSSTLVLKGLGEYNVRSTLLRSLLPTGRADKGLYNV
jgi:hypothetical protein